ncbi:methyltransferase domain-containing protein [Natrialbaceae archaeon AArc-T1-2]|uniref:methyltransferase domain-containing protein n=1 Tax=Natrialbaceae archaeon AArc-T1-2 TaxID=3053904 RepID=UPI00255AB367|nr:methyltransferase domain-containing protein [Natrialbaceae archaeon AArc-T1-2]WIV68683.1 methyltransferase domain-containing protein [Natrialbaceae archaeon AArc-T1-2]
MYLLELGGDDDAFAAFEARNAVTGCSLIAPGLAVARAVVPGRARGLAYTHRVSELVGRTDADVERARATLEAATVETDREGSVAVRATDVHGSSGVDTQRAERVLGRVLVERGFEVDLEEPDHVLRAAFSEGKVSETGPRSTTEGDEPTDERVSVCALGWLEVESVRDFGTRSPTDKPFFQPGSMDPLLARAVANVAGAGPGRTILDPMCGTGGVLVEAGLVGADVVGIDAQEKMVDGACENLGHYLEGDSPVGLPTGEWHVGRGDATRLPLADDAVDAVVFDAPYGRQSKIEQHRLEDLVAGALGETRRVASRAVVVADRTWADAAETAGWELEATFERRVHRSLTRYVMVLTHS